MTYKIEPHLRMAITPLCNLNCIYCKAGGESIAPNGCFLTKKEIVAIAKMANSVGFKHIKFTGGEPLIRKDIIEIIGSVCKTTNFKKKYLITNGLLLAKNAFALKKAGITDIVVSIDVAHPQKFVEINRGKKRDFYEILHGLKRCNAAGLPLTINMVVMKANLPELLGVIEIAKRHKAKLKLIDLMGFDDNVSFWRKQFVSFKKMDKLLKPLTAQTGFEQPIGNLGTIMKKYLLKNGVTVVIRDSDAGAFYHASCGACEQYPCQDAIYGARITHDGKLKKCLARNDNLINIAKCLKNKKLLKQKMVRFYKIFSEAEYQEKEPYLFQPTCKKCRKPMPKNAPAICKILDVCLACKNKVMKRIYGKK